MITSKYQGPILPTLASVSVVASATPPPSSNKIAHTEESGFIIVPFIGGSMAMAPSALPLDTPEVK